MSDRAINKAVGNPQDLARALVARQNAGDADGMANLYELDAVLDCGDGKLAVGREAIRNFYAQLIATGVKFEVGDQSPALIRGNIALTSTHLSDGTVTVEVARQQHDKTWLWVIDQPSVTL